MLALAFHHSSSRKIIEFGLLLVLLGGVTLIAGIHPDARKRAMPVSGVLIAVGALLALISVHFGASPFLGK